MSDCYFPPLYAAVLVAMVMEYITLVCMNHVVVFPRPTGYPGCTEHVADIPWLFHVTPLIASHTFTRHA